MNEHDSENIHDERLDGALKRWANDASDYRPIDVSEMALSAPKRRGAFAWRAAAVLAAAAMFVIALAQTSFTVSLGDTTLRWGDGASSELDTMAAALTESQARYAALEDRLNEHAEAINSVALDNALLGESLRAATFELAQRQELESAAHAYDMQHLARLVSFQP